MNDVSQKLRANVCSLCVIVCAHIECSIPGPMRTFDPSSPVVRICCIHNSLLRFNQPFQSMFIQFGIPYVCAYLDDILVTGRTDEEHLHNLDKVLSRLATAGMRLNVDKCTFMAPEVTYLGHRIDKEGLHAVNEKVQAIALATAPQNCKELRSYLGCLNYYGQVIKNL